VVKVLPKVMLGSTAHHGAKSFYALGGTMITFLREIPPLSKYYMYSRLFAWSPDDDKWLICQTVFTIPGKSGSQRRSDVPAIVPENEIVCAVMYSRYCMKKSSGKTIPMLEVLKDEGYTVSEDMLRLNQKNWEEVRKYEEMSNKTELLKSVRKFSRL
jgi:hypothetical protein